MGVAPVKLRNVSRSRARARAPTARYQLATGVNAVLHPAAPLPPNMLLSALIGTNAAHTCLAVPPRPRATLRDRGFAVLDHDPLDLSLVRPAATAICSELADLLNLATRLGCDANEQHYRFSEVCHRARLRWDMRVPDAAVDKLIDAAVERAMPVLRELDALPLHPDERRLPLARRLPLRPRVLMTGAIVSKRGATAQRFHSDAQRSHFFWSTLLPRHRLFNLFVPLVDVEQDGFGTQFWPGSHLGRTRLPRYRAAIERSGSIEDDEEAMAAMEAPACKAGGACSTDAVRLPDDAPRPAQPRLRRAAGGVRGHRDGRRVGHRQLPREQPARVGGVHRGGASATTSSGSRRCATRGRRISARSTSSAGRALRVCPSKYSRRLTKS